MAIRWSLTHSAWGISGLYENEAAFIHACKQTWGNHYRIEINDPYYTKQREERIKLHVEHGGIGGFIIALSLQNLALNPPRLDNSPKAKALGHLCNVLAENLRQGKPLWLAAFGEGWIVSRYVYLASFSWQIYLVLVNPLKLAMDPPPVSNLTATSPADTGVMKFPDFDNRLTPFHEAGKLPPLEERKEIVRKIRARTESRASQSSSARASISAPIENLSLPSTALITQTSTKKMPRKKKTKPTLAPASPDLSSDEEESKTPAPVVSTVRNSEPMSTIEEIEDTQGEWSTVKSKPKLKKKEEASEKIVYQGSKGTTSKAELFERSTANFKLDKTAVVGPKNGFRFQEDEFPDLLTIQHTQPKRSGPSAAPTTTISKFERIPGATYDITSKSSSQKAYKQQVRSVSKGNESHPSQLIPGTAKLVNTPVNESAVNLSLNTSLSISIKSAAEEDNDNDSVDSDKTVVPEYTQPAFGYAHNEQAKASAEDLISFASPSKDLQHGNVYRDDHIPKNLSNEMLGTSAKGQGTAAMHDSDPAPHPFRERSKGSISSFVSNPGKITVNGKDAAQILGNQFPPGLTVHDHPDTNHFLHTDWLVCAFCDGTIRETVEESVRGFSIPQDGALICSRCGPCSHIRYCSQACLLNDVTTHYAKCSKSADSLAGTFPLDWSHVPEHYYTILPALGTFSENSSHHHTRERTRQLTYIAHLYERGLPDLRKTYFDKLMKTPSLTAQQVKSYIERSQDSWNIPQGDGDYFLFVDHEYIEIERRFESGAGGPPGYFEGLSHKLFYHRQGEGLCPATAIPLRIFKDHRFHFNRLINACFVTNHPKLVEYLWRWIRAELAHNEKIDECCKKMGINTPGLFMLWTQQFEKEFGLSQERQLSLFDEPSPYTFDPYSAYLVDRVPYSGSDISILSLVYETELQFPLLRAWLRPEPGCPGFSQDQWARFRGEGFPPLTRPNGEVVHVNNAQLPWNNGWHGMPPFVWGTWLVSKHIMEIRKALDQYTATQDKLLSEAKPEAVLSESKSAAAAKDTVSSNVQKQERKWVILRDGIEMPPLDQMPALSETLFDKDEERLYQSKLKNGNTAGQQSNSSQPSIPAAKSPNTKAIKAVIFKSQLNPAVPEFKSKSPKKDGAARVEKPANAWTKPLATSSDAWLESTGFAVPKSTRGQPLKMTAFDRDVYNRWKDADRILEAAKREEMANKAKLEETQAKFNDAEAKVNEAQDKVWKLKQEIVTKGSAELNEMVAKEETNHSQAPEAKGKESGKKNTGNQPEAPGTHNSKAKDMGKKNNNTRNQPEAPEAKAKDMGKKNMRNQSDARGGPEGKGEELRNKGGNGNRYGKATGKKN